MADENTDGQPAPNAGPKQTTTPTPNTEPPAGFLSQDQVNAVVENRLAREREQHRKLLQDAGFDSFEDVAKLKQAQAAREKKELEDTQQYKELVDRIRTEKDEEIRKRDEELTTFKSRYLDSQAERSLVSAATKHGAIAPDQVAQLVRASVKVDDQGNAYIVDADGNRRTNGKGEELSVDAYVSSFLTDNPHFMKAADGRGAGGRSTGGGGAPSGDIDLARAKTDANYFLEHEAEITRMVKSGKLSA